MSAHFVARANRQGQDNVGIGHNVGFDGFTSPVDISRTVFIGASSSTPTDYYPGDDYASVSADDAIAIGFEAQSFQQYAMSMGTYAKSRSTKSIAIGPLSDVLGNFSIGLGSDIDINEENSVGLGYNVIMQKANSTAVGYQAKTYQGKQYSLRG